jgi:hypothetical protein
MSGEACVSRLIQKRWLFNEWPFLYPNIKLGTKPTLLADYPLRLGTPDLS